MVMTLAPDRAKSGRKSVKLARLTAVANRVVADAVATRVVAPAGMAPTAIAQHVQTV